jgi:hypothetical protein
MTQQRVLQQSESPITTTDSRPVPDPTTLTTQQLAVAIEGVKQLFDAKLMEMSKAVLLLQQAADRRPTIGEVSLKLDEKFIAIEQRFKDLGTYFTSSIESMSNGFHNDERFMSVWNGIKAERERSDQQFLRVDQQFVQLEKLAAQLKIAGDTAVAAALQAQKEAAGEQTKSSAAAISKSEAATGESIKQLQALFQTSIGGLTTQVLDLKSRLDKGEGGVTGKTLATDDYRYERGIVREAGIDSRSLIFGIVGMVIGVSAVISTIIIHFASK